MKNGIKVNVGLGELYFDTYIDDDVNAIIEYVKKVNRPLNVEVNEDGSCVVSGDELGLLLLLSDFAKVEIQL